MTITTINNLNVHLVQLQDLDSVFQLESDLFYPDNYPYFFFRQAFDSMTELFLVAKLGGKLVGYALGTLQAGRSDGWILGLAVSKAARRKGVATKLLQRLLNSFKEKGAKSGMLHVAPTNEVAIRLYTKHDFIEAGGEENYFGLDHARIVMRVGF